jgi:hypothetical protein
MAMIFGPKGQFFGAKCGKSEFHDGIIPFSKLHDLFSRYQTDLVPNGEQRETQNIISLFEALGICRRLGEAESKAFFHDEANGVYEFPELTSVSDLPFLPTDDNFSPDHKILCVVFDSISHYVFSKIRRKLIIDKDPKYKSFLNSIILRRHENMELWFQKGDKLYVIARGKYPFNSTHELEQVLGFDKV